MNPTDKKHPKENLLAAAISWTEKLCSADKIPNDKKQMTNSLQASMTPIVWNFEIGNWELFEI